MSYWVSVASVAFPVEIRPAAKLRYTWPKQWGVLSSSLGIAWPGHLLPALDGWPELISLPPSCCLGVRWVSSDIIPYCLSYIDGPSIERAFSREYWTIFLSAVPRWGSERVGSVCIGMWCICCQTPWSPNVVAEWLALLLLIREVQGLDLCPETGFPDSVFIVFLSPSKQMLE